MDYLIYSLFVFSERKDKNHPYLIFSQPLWQGYELLSGKRIIYPIKNRPPSHIVHTLSEDYCTKRLKSKYNFQTSSWD